MFSFHDSMDVFLFVLAILLFTCLLLLIAICSYSVCLDKKVMKYLSKAESPYYKVGDADDYVMVDTFHTGIQPVGQKDIRGILNDELNESRNKTSRFRDFAPIRVTDALNLDQRQRQPDSGMPPLGYGKLCFSLRYDADSQILTVHLISGRQITLKGGEAAKWPIVNIRMVEFDDSEQQSAPDESTNPEYDQEFTFYLPSDKVGETSVLFTIWDLHTDMQKTNIGYIKVSLGNFIETLLSKDGTGPLSREIRDTEIEDIPKRKNGDILFSLSYHRESDSLSVAILKCKGVSTELEDIGIYVKVVLLVDGWHHRHQKTATKPKQSDPTFKQIINFDNCIADDGLNIEDLGLFSEFTSENIISSEASSWMGIPWKIGMLDRGREISLGRND